MPELDGYATTRRIRQMETQAATSPPDVQPTEPANPQRHTAIIALTAHAFPSDLVTSLEHRCDDFMTKPFTATALLEMIACHLNVRYAYKEEPQTVSKTTKPLLNLTVEDLQVMPLIWVSCLHDAAMSLSDLRVLELLEQIPPEHQTLKQGLEYLVENFHLDEIATLTQFSDELPGEFV